MKMAEILGDGYQKKLSKIKNFNMKNNVFILVFWGKT